MNTILKRIFTLSLIAVFITSLTIYGDEQRELVLNQDFDKNYDILYKLSEKTDLTHAVTHETIQLLTSVGWMNVNVVRANLNDEHTYTKPLYNTDGISTKVPLSTMIKQAGAIAGINGDFFNSGNPSNPFGAVISGTDVITTPLLAPDYLYPTISLSKTGSVDISQWNPYITISSPVTKNVLPIQYLNKAVSSRYNVVILDKFYGEKSIGNMYSTNSVELVVDNNVVKEIRINKPGVKIPNNGYVVTCSSSSAHYLKDLFKVGERINLNIKFDFDLKNLQWAVGGVNHLVKDGKLNVIDNTIKGVHPRSAIGFTKNNDEMIFVTIDGRNKNYVGATQEQLAEIMVSLGAYNAVNLDGGGSTEIGVDFLKNGEISVVNIPSDGKERKIASGIGIFSKAPESTILNSIEIIPQYDKIFNGSEINLSVKGYNKYMSEIDISNKVVKYSVKSGRGTIKDNKLKANSTGEIIVTATVYSTTNTSIDTFTNDFIIKVLDKPEILIFEDTYLEMEASDTYEFKNILGVDKNGETAYIDPNKISWSYRNSIGKIVDGIFTASNTNNVGAITATYGNAIKHITVHVGYNPQTIFSFEKDDMDKISGSAYPNGSNIKVEFSDKIYKEKYGAIKLSYDFTNMTDQSIASVNFGKNQEGLKIIGTPKAIGMWVYGDGSTHWLRTGIQDKNGKIHKIDFAEEVDWKGWKWVVAKLPEDFLYPATVKNIYLAELNETKKDTGHIFIDNLRALFKINKTLNLKQESVLKDEEYIKITSNYLQKLSIDSFGKITIDAKDNKDFGAKYLNLVINNETLGFDSKIWNQLNALSSLKNQTIILLFNNSIDKISDERERKAINSILEEIALNNKLYIVNKGDKSSAAILDGTRYISYTKQFNFYITKNGIKYSN